MEFMESILVVDDVETNRVVLRAAIEERYQVIEASNGQEALDILKGNPHVIAAILLDLVMPVMDGFGFLRIVKENKEWNHIPIVVTTEVSSAGKELQALNLGADEFLRKPFHTEIIAKRITNIIRKQKLEQMLEHKDPLTGIYTLDYFNVATKKMLEENKDDEFVFVLWDVEHFKVINDLFGREVGNHVLQRMAQGIRESMIGIGTFGRIERDRFCACVRKEGFDPEELRSKVNLNLAQYELHYPVETKLGIFEIKDRGLPVDLMCDRARLALNSIKGNYLEHYAYFRPDMRKQLLFEQEILSEMERALEQEQFVVYLQPIYSIYQEKPVSAEALVRWNHPTLGLLQPGQFVPLFEENGFITKLDRYIWDKTCQFIAKNLSQNTLPLTVSVNVSRMSFYNPELSNIIIGLTNKYQIPPHVLRLEITETSYTDSPENLLYVMKKLQEQGFQILMDDFGSGYSSLSMLREVPVDILKIDMDFVENVNTSGRAANVLTSIVRMAKWLKIDMIVEGVENKAQVDFLQSIGCDVVQGNYFGTAMPQEDFIALIQEDKEDYLEYKKHLLEQIDFDHLWLEDSMAMNLFDGMIGGMSVYELKDGKLKVLRVNEEYYRIMGTNSVELFADNQAAFQKVYEDDREKLITYCNTAKKERKVTEGVVRRFCAEEKLLWLQVKVRYIGEDGSHSLFYIYFYDITEQKKLETKASRHQFFAALTSVYGEIYELNYTDDTALQIHRTDAIADLIGEESQRSYGYEITVNQMLHPADRQKYIDLFSLEGVKNHFGNQKKQSEFIEVRFRHPDGNYYWSMTGLIRVENVEHKDIFLACTKDISEIKEAERALEVHRELKRKELQAKAMQKILSYVPAGVGIYELGDETKRVYVNDRLCEIFGVTKESKEQLCDFDVRHLPFDKNSYEEEKEHEIASQVVLANRVDGSPFWLRMLLKLRRDEDGRIFCHCVMSDATKQVKMEEEYHRQSELYNLVMKDVKDIIFEYKLSEDTINIYNNESLEGHRKEVFENASHSLYESPIIHDDYKDYVGKHIKLSMSRAMVGEYDYKANHSGEGYCWYRAQYRSTEGADGKVNRIFGRIRKITEEKRLTNRLMEEKMKQEKLKKRASIDLVTGLYNRSTMQELVQHGLDHNTKVAAFFLCDLDNFKKVNDTKGHQIGDQLLREVAKKLKEIFGKHDVIGRLGGDEFVVYIDNAGNRGFAGRKAKKMIDEIKSVGRMIDHDINLGVSIGIAMVPEDGRDFTVLYQKADLKLYEAKRKGKNQFYFV